jgi:glycosyltransferase involved in cell wall biosynthesis
VVVGDGPLRPDLEEEVARRGLADHVTLLGFRVDVEAVMGASQLLLMTSDAEGIPGVAIESQMTGCPMVTFPLGGVSEVVEDEVTGIVLDRFDTALMARRVAELLQDRERLEAMGQAGRDRSAEFAFGRVAATYATQLLALRDGLVPVTEVEPAGSPLAPT